MFCQNMAYLCQTASFLSSTAYDAMPKFQGSGRGAFGRKSVHNFVRSFVRSPRIEMLMTSLKNSRLPTDSEMKNTESVAAENAAKDSVFYFVRSMRTRFLKISNSVLCFFTCLVRPSVRQSLSLSVHLSRNLESSKGSLGITAFCPILLLINVVPKQRDRADWTNKAL